MVKMLIVSLNFQFDRLGTDPGRQVDRSPGPEVDSHLGVSGSATD